MKVLVLFALVIVVASGSISGQQAGKGRVEGTVVSFDSSQPIGSVDVTLFKGIAPPQVAAGPIPFCTILPSGAGSASGFAPRPLSARPGSQTQRTDSKGFFSFDELDPGPYRLIASKTGYMRQEFGQTGFGVSGSVLQIAAAKSRNVVLQLVETGAVNGRVFDSRGNPLQGISVQLIQSTYNAAGERVYEPHRLTGTNDRGEYRLFDVFPGRYYLVAGCPDFPLQGKHGFPWVVYPGGKLASAVAVDVLPQSDLKGMDFQFTQVFPRSIRGRIVDRTGQAARNIGLFVVYAPEIGGGGTVPNLADRYDPATGTFELSDFVPGIYRIVASAAATATTPFLRDVATVEVSTADVNGLVLQLSGTTLRGSVRIEGAGTIPDVNRFSIELRPLLAGAPFSVVRRTPSSTGEVIFEGLLSIDYRIAAVAFPPGFYLKSATYGTNDVLQRPLRVTAEASDALVFTLGTNAGQIAGSVLDEQGHPVDGTMTVLVPNQRNRIELFQTSITDANGQYSFANVPPGEYKVFAWESLAPYAYFGADFIGPSEDQGEVASLLEGSKIHVNVDLIRVGNKGVTPRR